MNIETHNNLSTKSFSDFDLLSTLHAAVRSERQVTLRVLELLKQVEQRKLYLSLGFGSLMEFCIQEPHYSESAAYHRISAMRALCDVPVLEKKIEDGSLAVISQAQSHIRQKEKTDFTQTGCF